METSPNFDQSLLDAAKSLTSYLETLNNLRNQLQQTQAELSSRLNILSKAALITETDLYGNITYANDRFCEVTGYSLEELIGKPHNIVRHPDMPKEFFKRLWDTIQSGKVFQDEIKNRRRDGSVYWVIATVAPVLGPDGKPVRYISARFEITKLKQMEETLKAQQRELLENMNVAAEIVDAIAPPKNIEIPYFVYHRPQQVLSGDFYWLHGDRGYLIGMVGDSIGHGVSAAFVAVVFKQLMQFLVAQRGVWRPVMIAEELDKQMSQIFSRRLRQPVTVDGIVFALDIPRRVFSYSSFQGKATLIRNREAIPLERMPFSFGELLGRAADEARLDLQPGDRLYFYSDGLPSQRIENDQRLGRKGVNQLLLDLQEFPIEKQKLILEEKIHDLLKVHPQTDDILLMGIEI